MVSSSRCYRLFPILAVLSLLLIAPAWAQVAAPKCDAAPICSAVSPAPTQQISSTELEALLADLRSPAPVLKSIIGPCCTGGSAKCPKVTGYRVVGCGANCGTGNSACLYLHN